MLKLCLSVCGNIRLCSWADVVICIKQHLSCRMCFAMWGLPPLHSATSHHRAARHQLRKGVLRGRRDGVEREGGEGGGDGCNPPHEFRIRLLDLMKPQCLVRTWSCEAGLLLQRDTQHGKSPTLMCVFCSPQRCIMPRLRPTNEIWNGGSRCKNPVPLLMLKYLKRGVDRGWQPASAPELRAATLGTTNSRVLDLNCLGNRGQPPSYPAACVAAMPPGA